MSPLTWCHGRDTTNLAGSLWPESNPNKTMSYILHVSWPGSSGAWYQQRKGLRRRAKTAKSMCKTWLDSGSKKNAIKDIWWKNKEHLSPDFMLDNFVELILLFLGVIKVFWWCKRKSSFRVRIWGWNAIMGHIYRKRNRNGGNGCGKMLANLCEGYPAVHHTVLSTFLWVWNCQKKKKCFLEDCEKIGNRKSSYSFSFSRLWPSVISPSHELLLDLTSLWQPWTRESNDGRHIVATGNELFPCSPENWSFSLIQSSIE